MANISKMGKAPIEPDVVGIADHFLRAAELLGKKHPHDVVDFVAINRAALARLPDLLTRWLPDGHKCGREWVAKNPTRHDRRPGSFSINMISGRWADFATGEKGGDPVSLAAFLFGLSQVEAARRLRDMLGIAR